MQGGANGSYFKLENYIEDFEKVILLLKQRYGKDISIFVNGHSWGGYLTPAFLSKKNNQELVKGWIQTDGAHNFTLLNKYSKQTLLDKAKIEIAANKNVAKWTEIRDFCNELTFPNIRKVRNFYFHAFALIESLNFLLGTGIK